MGRVDERLVGQRQQFFLKGIIELPAQVLGVHAGCGQQVGAAHIADEERVSGEDRMGLDLVLFQVEDEQADGFRRMAGRLEGLQTDGAKVDGIAILERDEVIVGPPLRAEVDIGAGALLDLHGRR